MKYLKINPIGVDKEISHLQDWLYDKLLGLGWQDYECYGRAYLNKNPREDKKNIIEVCINGKDYKEITMDDNHIVTSVFVLKSVKHDGLAKANVSLIFNINLKKLFNGDTRMDEETIIDIMSVIHVNPASFELGEVKRGIKDVYSEFNINTQERDNMSNYLVCSFDLTVTYIHEIC